MLYTYSINKALHRPEKFIVQEKINRKFPNVYIGLNHAGCQAYTGYFNGI